MLGVGWTEMFVLGVVALIVIGPKELPNVMNKIGRFAGTVRRMGADFQRELNKSTGLDEVKNLRNAITQPLKSTTDAIRKEFNTTTPSGKVEPSGVLKPADPKAESVVDEIHKAAGMAKPAEPVKGAPVKAASTPKPTRPAKGAGPATDEPAKAAAVTAIGPSTASPPVTSANLSPAAKPQRPRKPKAAAGGEGPSKPKSTSKPRAKKATASAAPAAETTAPSKRKPAAKKTS